MNDIKTRLFEATRNLSEDEWELARSLAWMGTDSASIIAAIKILLEDQAREHEAAYERAYGPLEEAGRQ